MILVKPGNISHTFKVFIRTDQSDYDIKFINQSTKESTVFSVPANLDEGSLTFKKTFKFKDKIFYIMLISSNGNLENYSIIYCDTVIEQRYHAITESFKEPDVEKPEYIMG